MVHCPHKFAESSDLHISLFPGEDLILQTADWWVLGPQPELLKKVILYQPPFPWFQSETVLRNPSTNCKSISIIVHHHYIAKYQWRNIKASQKWRQKNPKISGLPDSRTPARACLELPGPSFQGTQLTPKEWRKISKIKIWQSTMPFQLFMWSEGRFLYWKSQDLKDPTNMGMRVPQIYGCYLYHLICAVYASFELGINELQ